METLEKLLSPDRELEKDICRLIRDKVEGVHVVVEGRDVHLSGDVEDYDTKRDVFATAQAVPGVRYVVDHVRVLPKDGVRIPWEENSPESLAFIHDLLGRKKRFAE